MVESIIAMVTWVFGSVVILISKKALTLYEGVSLISGIFKIYVCVNLDYNFRYQKKKNIIAMKLGNNNLHKLLFYMVSKW